MGFDIPMTSKGALDSSSLLSLNGSSAGQIQDNPFNAGMSQGSAPTPQSNYNGGYQQGNAGMQSNVNGGMQSNVNGGMQSNVNGGMQSNGGMPQNNYGQQPNMNTGYQQGNYGGGYQQGNAGMQNNNYGATPQNNPMVQSQQAVQPKQRPAGGGVKLKKGQKFALAGAGGAQLSRIKLGLGWDLKNQACDLDASAFMLDASGRILNGDESWFVFYGQTTSPDGSVTHSGDSQGAGVGDDETIVINLNQVNPQVQKIAFVVTIDEALAKGQNFSMVDNAYVRIIDDGTGAEIARFNLTDYYANVTAMVVGELYRHNGSWKFNPVGDGVAKDLAGLCEFYGVRVAD